MLLVKLYLIGAIISFIANALYIKFNSVNRSKAFVIRGLVIYTVMSFVGIFILLYGVYYGQYVHNKTKGCYDAK